MFDVEQEVLEEEGAPGDCVGSCQPGNVTGQARGQLQEPGDTLTQTAAGVTQPAATKEPSIPHT